MDAKGNVVQNGFGEVVIFRDHRFDQHSRVKVRRKSGRPGHNDAVILDLFGIIVIKAGSWSIGSK